MLNPRRLACYGRKMSESLRERRITVGVCGGIFVSWISVAVALAWGQRATLGCAQRQ